MPLLKMRYGLPLPACTFDYVGAKEEAGPIPLPHQARSVGTLACGCAPSTG